MKKLKFIALLLILVGFIGINPVSAATTLETNGNKQASVVPVDYVPNDEKGEKLENPKTGAFVPVAGISVLILISIICLRNSNKNNVLNKI